MTPMDQPLPEMTRAVAPDARAYVNLGRIPATPAAQALVADVTARVEPHLARKRVLGTVGRAALLQDVGAVLAGFMREGFKGNGVRAQRSPSGPMWQVVGASMGRDRFWAVIEALGRAGLVDCWAGVRTPGEWRDGRGGVASIVQPSPILLSLAEAHGATLETRKADWTTDRTLLALMPPGAALGTVTVRPLQGVALGMTPGMEAALAGLQAELEAINACNATADIRGAGSCVVLTRRFRHSLGFGGRFYGPAYITTSAEERLAITINGEPVVEIDLKASQLTLLAGLTGCTLPPGDPYAIEGIRRDVVKAWVVQSLGSGRPARQWSDRIAAGIGAACKPRDVWEALKPRLPFLADLAGVVPAADLAGLDAGRHGWAVGQYLAQREAAVIARALSVLAQSGIPALPVHDSLIVPSSALNAAKEALVAAFEAGAGVTPRLDVERLDAAGRVVTVSA